MKSVMHVVVVSFVAFAILLSSEMALSQCDYSPSPGTATVDGDISEWDLSSPTGYMHEAWETTKPATSKFYLRYDCPGKTMYVLVLADADKGQLPVLTTPDPDNGILADTHIRFDNKNKLSTLNPQPGQVIVWVDPGYDPTVPYPHAKGYEGSFPLDLGGNASVSFAFRIHVNVYYNDLEQTSGIGLSGVYLCVDNCIIGIELNSFEAYACEQGVMLEWNVAAEINHAGYNIYRSERDGEYAKINAELISAPLGRGSRQYEYLDNVQPGIYFYRLEDISLDGESAFYGPIQAASLTQVTNASDVPTTYSLSANYPNPFNPATTISYTLPEQSEIQLTIYDVHGKQIKNLMSGPQFAGTYAVTWDGTNDAGDMVASGTYLYRLVAGDVVKTARMTLLK